MHRSIERRQCSGIVDGSAALGLCLLLPSVPDDLVAQHVQLVLSDPVTQQGAQYGIVSPRRWRFVDNGRRLDFLLAGLGWCKMPTHIVTPLLDDGRLVLLQTSDQRVVPSTRLLVYAAHVRAKLLGPVGTWLSNDLRQRLVHMLPASAKFSDKPEKL